MGRRVSLHAIVAAALATCLVCALPALAAKRTKDRAALHAVKQRLDRDTERRIDSLMKRMKLEEKLNQLDAPLRRPAEGEPLRGPPRRRRLQRDRPRADQQVPARGGRQLPPGHPDPVRLRHDPRLPDGVPDPAGHGQQLRSQRRQGRPPHRRFRVGRRRAQADLQPDGRRLARGALGPDRRGRTARTRT